ncbi:MAG: nucleotidyltransferase family protein [Halioglobus sp.]
MNAPSHKQEAPYRLHRAALQPLLGEACYGLAAKVINKEGEAGLLKFLQEQGLAPMWANALEQGGQSTFSSDFFDALHQYRMTATGEYLIQRNRLKDLRKVLDGEAIPHVVYKGVAIRERFYQEPSLRPAVDIDVLVDQRDRTKAAKALHKAGFLFQGKAENISHEASLIKGKCVIDLHWHILRPGRTRRPMSRTLIETRQDYGTHWGLSDEASFFVILVHPVFVRYSTTPLSSLMRLIDLLNLIEMDGWVWEKTLSLLDLAGLKTAAWITLRWLQLLTGRSIEEEKLREVAPGKVRQFYLNVWLEKNLATRLLEKPALVQTAFTLFAQDRPSDALRAIRLKKQAEKTAYEDLVNMESSLA